MRNAERGSPIRRARKLVVLHCRQGREGALSAERDDRRRRYLMKMEKLNFET